MKKQNKVSITLLTILTFSHFSRSKILKYPLKVSPQGTTLTDMNLSFRALKESNFFHPVKRSNIFSKKHDSIYALSLSQDRNKIAYFIQLEVGDSKEKLDFMIDSGNKFIPIILV